VETNFHSFICFYGVYKASLPLLFTSNACLDSVFKSASTTFQIVTGFLLFSYTGYKQKVNKKFISHLTRAQRTPTAAATLQVSHALPAVRFSCLLRCRRASFQDGVTAGRGFLRAPL
jgi:hypothetical protein